MCMSHESLACLSHKRVQVLAGRDGGTNVPVRSPARRNRVDNCASTFHPVIDHRLELHNAGADDDAVFDPTYAAPPESRYLHRGGAGLRRSCAASPTRRRITGCRPPAYSAKLLKPVALVE